MILLALLLAATPINAKTLRARSESNAATLAFRQALAEVKQEALSKAWEAASLGLYKTTYCPWHIGYSPNILAVNVMIMLSQLEIGVSQSSGDCIAMDWSKP